MGLKDFLNGSTEYTFIFSSRNQIFPLKYKLTKNKNKTTKPAVSFDLQIANLVKTFLSWYFKYEYCFFLKSLESVVTPSKKKTPKNKQLKISAWNNQSGTLSIC